MLYPFETKNLKGYEKIKQMKKISLSLLSLLMILCLTACFGNEEPQKWETVSYSEDTTIGTGTKTAIVEIVNDGKTITLTVKTDEETLGAALLKEKVIAGDDSDYGLYVKAVNGVIADYDSDGFYWGFYINGDFATTGVDSTPIEEGKIYRLSKEKG